VSAQGAALGATVSAQGAALPLERFFSHAVSRFPGWRLYPTLRALARLRRRGNRGVGMARFRPFPRWEASVVSADFVPLTVAGQRWLYTSFPGHRKRPCHADFCQSWVLLPYILRPLRRRVNTSWLCARACRAQFSPGCTRLWARSG